MMFWKKKSPPKGFSDAWAVYSYVYGDQMRAIVSFDVTAAREKEHQGHPHCVRMVIRVPMNAVRENGIPAPPALDELQRVEESFLKILQKDRVDFRLVGKMTYGGMRDFVFQVEDVAAFKQTVSEVTPQGGFTVQLIEKPGWTFFEEKVKPAPVYWQQIRDFQVIQGLIQAGSNPNSPHLLEHIFTGDRPRLQSLKADLLTKGFSEVSFSDTQLVMARASVLELDKVFDHTAKLFTLSPQMGVQYEGWGARITR